MKERIVELEKLRNINTVPSKAIEEDFTIEATDKGEPCHYLLIFFNKFVCRYQIKEIK